MTTFSEYQEATRETAIYPEAGTGSGLAMAYVGLGLGETGEIQNNIKKIIRDDDGVVTPERKKSLLKEAGDVMWYLARLADELQVTLEDIAEMNLEKLSSRMERGQIKGSGDDR